MSKMRNRVMWGVALAAMVALWIAAPALASDGPGYDLSWWTVDGGGAVVDVGGYRLGGTAGQPDAAAWVGGMYGLNGGFWAGVMAEYPLYLPLVLREAA